MRPILMLFAALSLAGCADKRPILAIPPARCADLVPAGWAAGVEATSIPDNAPGLSDWLGKPLTASMAAALIAPWASAYVGMSGQLEKANGRQKDTVTIQANCEKMVNDARP